MRMLTLWFALLFATGLSAQGPELVLAPKIPVPVLGKPVVLPVETDAKTVVWVCHSDVVFFTDSNLLADKRTGHVTVTKPGEYKVTAVGIGANGLTTLRETVLVTEGAPAKKEEVIKKEDPPALPPVAPPPAATVPRRLRFVIVEANAAGTVASKKKFDDDAALLGYLAQKGHKLPFFIDRGLKDNPSPEIAPDLLKSYLSYINAAGTKQLPWVFVLPIEGGKELYQGPLPEPADFLDVVKKYEKKDRD